MSALFRIAAPMGTSGLRAGSPSRANGHIPQAPLPHDACAYLRRLALRTLAVGFHACKLPNIRSGGCKLGSLGRSRHKGGGERTKSSRTTHAPRNFEQQIRNCREANQAYREHFRISRSSYSVSTCLKVLLDLGTYSVKSETSTLSGSIARLHHRGEEQNPLISNPRHRTSNKINYSREGNQ